ncbi:MAG TPA: chorismate-binding protein [Thermoanaerobaculaceae bacterium]|nr:chorismate-binding protein [Thermoanaerobaculaceae bacterium]HRS16438.1 chorismate-binding protein [Thermoanaerobaculaceae bacterium]
MRLSDLEQLPSFALLGPGFAGDWLLLTELVGAPTSPCLVLAPFEAKRSAWVCLDGRVERVDLEVDVVPEPLPVVLEPTGYLEQVESIRQAIAAGDVYQVCLARFARLPACPGSLLAAALWRSSPPSYAAWVRLSDGVELVSASPELLLATEGRRARTEPMKGTAGPEAAGALAASGKDAAELAMITDLLRNDLTPVCLPRSVRVVDPRRFVTLPYAVQTVSVVEGELAPGIGPLDALAALHPGGSVTGAPKLAALRLLRALEGGPRGLYCGALGFLRGGRSAFSLLIRTAARTAEGWAYGVGSGIVFDSDPAAELEELHVKLGTLSASPARPVQGPASRVLLQPHAQRCHLPPPTAPAPGEARSRYTLLRVTRRGVVLLDFHLRRLGADVPGPGREALLAFLASARPGVWAVWLEGGAVRAKQRPGSRLADGMPVCVLPSPLSPGAGLIRKPPSPGPYDAVRTHGVVTLLTSPDRCEIWEACSAAVLGWDGAHLVVPPPDRPRVWSAAEAAVREHFPVVEAPLPLASSMPLLLVNAVKGTCAPELPGRAFFPADARDRVERLLESLTRGVPGRPG